MNYPLCEKLGLKVEKKTTELRGNGAITSQSDYYIKASEVERLLSEGVEVFGTASGGPYTEPKWDNDTHQGLLIGYKPIEKEQPVSVTKENLAKAWDKCAWLHDAHKSKAFADFCKELGL